MAYLKAVIGHRTVPVEVGAHYLDEKLDEKLMTVSTFIERFIEVGDRCREGLPGAAPTIRAVATAARRHTDS